MSAQPRALSLLAVAQKGHYNKNKTVQQTTSSKRSHITPTSAIRHTKPISELTNAADSSTDEENVETEQPNQITAKKDKKDKKQINKIEQQQQQQEVVSPTQFQSTPSNDDEKSQDEVLFDTDDESHSNGSISIPKSHDEELLEAKKKFQEEKESKLHDVIKNNLQGRNETDVLEFRFPWIRAKKSQTTVQTATSHSFPLVDLTYVNTNVTNENELMGDDIRAKSKRAGFKVDENGLAQQHLRFAQALYGNVFTYPGRSLFSSSLFHYRIFYNLEQNLNHFVQNKKNKSNSHVETTAIGIENNLQITNIEPYSFQHWNEATLKHIELFRSFKRIAPIMGLENAGNTCFLNTALQQLLSTPSIVSFLLSTAPNYIIIEVIIASATNLLDALMMAKESGKRAFYSSKNDQIDAEYNALSKFINTAKQFNRQCLELLQSNEYTNNHTLKFPKKDQSDPPPTDPTRAQQHYLHTLNIQLDQSNPLHLIPVEHSNPLYQLARYDPHRIFCPRTSQLTTNKRGQIRPKFCTLCALSRLAIQAHGFANRIDVELTRYLCNKGNIDYDLVRNITLRPIDLIKANASNIFNKKSQNNQSHISSLSFRTECITSAHKTIDETLKTNPLYNRPAFSIISRFDRVTPSSICSQINKIMTDIAFFGSQEDSQECLQALIDTADTSWIQSSLIPFPHSTQEDIKKYWWDIAAQRGGGKTHRAAEINRTSPLHQLVGGSMLQSFTCQTCQHVSSTVQYFTSLALDFPPQNALKDSNSNQNNSNGQNDRNLALLRNNQTINGNNNNNNNNKAAIPKYTLQELFKHTYRTEIFDGENAYSCEKCKAKRRAVKTTKLLTLPNVLFVHLNRFTVSGMSAYGTPRFRKIISPVSITERLDVGEFMDKNVKTKLQQMISQQQSQHGIKNKQKNHNLNQNDHLETLSIHQHNTNIYHLQATAVHMGQMSGGHYYSYARYGPSPLQLQTYLSNAASPQDRAQRERDVQKGFWFQIDDESAIPASFDRDVNSGDSYVLTYVKECASIPTTQVLSSPIELLLTHQAKLKEYMASNQSRSEIVKNEQVVGGIWAVQGAHLGMVNQFDPINLATSGGMGRTTDKSPSSALTDGDIHNLNQTRGDKNVDSSLSVTQFAKAQKSVAKLSSPGLLAAESSSEGENDEDDDEDDDEDEDFELEEDDDEDDQDEMEDEDDDNDDIVSPPVVANISAKKALFASTKEHKLALEKSLQQVPQNSKPIPAKTPQKNQIIDTDMMYDLAELSTDDDNNDGPDSDEYDEDDADFIDDGGDEELQSEEEEFISHLRREKQGVKKDAYDQKQRLERVKKFDLKSVQKTNAWASSSSSSSSSSESPSESELSESTQKRQKRKTPQQITEELNRRDRAEKVLLKTSPQNPTRGVLKAQLGKNNLTTVGLSKSYLKTLNNSTEAEVGESTDDDDADYEDDIPDDEKVDLYENGGMSEVSESEGGGSPGEWVNTSTEPSDNDSTDSEDELIREAKLQMAIKSKRKEEKKAKKEARKKLKSKSLLEAQLSSSPSSSPSPSNDDNTLPLQGNDLVKLKPVKNKRIILDSDDDDDDDDDDIRNDITQTTALPSALKSRKQSKLEATAADEELFKNMKGVELNITQRKRQGLMSAHDRKKREAHSTAVAAAIYTQSAYKNVQEDDSDDSDDGNSMYITKKDQRKELKELEKADKLGGLDQFSELRRQMLTTKDENEIAFRKDKYEQTLDIGRLKKVRAEFAGKDKAWEVKKEQQKRDSFNTKRQNNKRKSPEPLSTQEGKGYGDDRDTKRGKGNQGPVISKVASVFDQKALALERRNADVDTRHNTVSEVFEKVDQDNEKTTEAMKFRRKFGNKKFGGGFNRGKPGGRPGGHKGSSHKRH